MFLREPAGAVVLALKTSSMGRGVTAPAHLKTAEGMLAGHVGLAPSVRLDPFYRSHYLLGGRLRGAAPGPRRAAPDAQERAGRTASRPSSRNGLRPARRRS